ncbi:MAG: hypothetical protein WC752_02670 [Patescibacteria group bacterium]|jgi:hypothetical protein
MNNIITKINEEIAEIEHLNAGEVSALGNKDKIKLINELLAKYKNIVAQLTQAEHQILEKALERTKNEQIAKLYKQIKDS